MGRPDMFIYSTIKKINKGKEIILYNHGKSLRDFTYIDDVIKVFIKSVSKKINNNPIINICSSSPINILKITNIIGKILRKKIRVRFRNSRKGEMDKTHGSNVFLKKIFKIKNFTKINKGLRNIVYSQQNSL
jgi:UDP-glucuronate 4-epimerase